MNPYRDLYQLLEECYKLIKTQLLIDVEYKGQKFYLGNFEMNDLFFSGTERIEESIIVVNFEQFIFYNSCDMYSEETVFDKKSVLDMISELKDADDMFFKLSFPENMIGPSEFTVFDTNISIKELVDIVLRMKQKLEDVK